MRDAKELRGGREDFALQDLQGAIHGASNCDQQQKYRGGEIRHEQERFAEEIVDSGGSAS